MSKKLLAEFLGTFWLVFGGCGSAVLAAAFPDVGIGLLGVALRLRPDRADHGLCGRRHFRRPLQSGRLGRPAGRRPASSAQGSDALCRRPGGRRCRRLGGALSRSSAARRTSPASAASPPTAMASIARQYSTGLGAAHRGRADLHVPDDHPRLDAGRVPAGFAPIAIGLALTLIHLISIPVTNTSVNPARSTGPALFVGGSRCSSSGCSGWRRSSARHSPASPTSRCSRDRTCAGRAPA